jgi:hypothetical protein
MPEAGDFQGTTPPLDPHATKSARIVIDHVIG